MSVEKRCSMCSEPATVFMTTIVGGEVKEVCYCSKHAEEVGALNPGSYGFIDYEKLKTKAKQHGPSCVSCGMTLSEIKKESRFGCAGCYEMFDEYLKAVLQKMHRSQTHLGKIPQNAISLDLVSQRVEALEKELGELIAKERFEDAAQIRDTLNNFKDALNSLKEQ